MRIRVPAIVERFPVPAIVERWIDVLVALLFGWREASRARHSLMVSFEKGRYVVRRSDPKRDALVRPAESQPVVATVAPGKSVPRSVADAAGKGLVIVELPADKVVTRSISVPAQAREFLSGIVANQIERLSPWPADQAVHGFAAEANGEDAASLDVRVSIASREVVDGARAEVGAIGLEVDRVVSRGRDGDTTKPVTVWSRLADVTREERERLRRQIAVGIAGVVVVSLGLSVWAVVSAQSLRAESERMVARTKALQRQILQGGRTPQAIAALSPPERAWYAKETSPSAVIVLEALSRALPDTAHLTELRFENATLRVIGLANDAPSLIAPLQQSGHLADVRFFAPTTRGSDGTLFRFHIEGRIEPRLKIAED